MGGYPSHFYLYHFVPIYLFFYQSIYVTLFLFMYLSNNQPINLSIFLSSYLYTYILVPYIYLSLYLLAQ